MFLAKCFVPIYGLFSIRLLLTHMNSLVDLLH